MRLEPDFELLERIGILSNPFIPYLHPGGYQMEVEETDFKTLSPFLIRWGAGEALQELFFYQLNFVPICEPPKPQTLHLIQENQTYFESRIKLEKMDFSKLENIKLNFGKGVNADLPPDLVKYFGEWIRKELESEKPKDATASEKLQQQKKIEKDFQNSKLKIQKSLPKLEAILKVKNPEATFEQKQIMLCAYGIFYQRGHRLDFTRKKRLSGEDDPNPFSNQFKEGMEDDTWQIIKSHLPKDLF